jgi:hypothetical protein
LLLDQPSAVSRTMLSRKGTTSQRRRRPQGELGLHPHRGEIDQDGTSTRPSIRSTTPAASSSSRPATLTKGSPQHLPHQPVCLGTKIWRSESHRPPRTGMNRAGSGGIFFKSGAGPAEQPRGATFGHRLHAALAAKGEGQHAPWPPPVAGTTPSSLTCASRQKFFG